MTHDASNKDGPTERQPEPREAISHKEHEPSLRVEELVEALRAPSFRQDSQWHDPKTVVYVTKPKALLEEAAMALLSLRPEPVGGGSSQSQPGYGECSLASVSAEPSASEGGER